MEEKIKKPRIEKPRTRKIFIMISAFVLLALAILAVIFYPTNTAPATVQEPSETNQAVQTNITTPSPSIISVSKYNPASILSVVILISLSLGEIIYSEILLPVMSEIIRVALVNSSESS